MLRLLSKSPRSRRIYSGPGPHSSSVCCPRRPFLRHGFASIRHLDSLPKPGESLHGFILRGIKHVPELELTALRFEHERTGADYLHVAREDRNNVFSIGFKTNPPDATGVPHILEHTTLCGSQRHAVKPGAGFAADINRYPVRDPFFKMLRRSLSNFMNAFTSADHTSYPFATTNAQDFKNLLSVYIDATLHPLLREHDFLQEGWRIGPDNPLAASSHDAVTDRAALAFKGVVYNEMKGQMSDSSYLYYTRFRDHIFPELKNSGGDPARMTELTSDKLKKFHREHYHPSNARIYTYGNLPVMEHTASLAEGLSGFNRRRADTTMKQPINLEAGAVNVKVDGPIDTMLDPERQVKTSISWTMGDTSNVVENFALSILSSLLIEGYGSPLYQSLIESGLGVDFSPNTGYDGSSRTAIFSVGAVGVSPQKTELVHDITKKTLREVQSKGFDQSKIDGILHQLELALKHKTANFGMMLMQRVETSWFNGLNPLEAIAWDETVNAFRHELQRGRYLENLMGKYLLNDRTLTFTMEPSVNFEESVAREEKIRLDAKFDEAVKINGSAMATIESYNLKECELLGEQNAAPDQDLSCLPTLHVKDIPRSTEPKPIRTSSVNAVDVRWREAPTNGLTYFRGIHEMRSLPTRLRKLLPLFTDAIMRLGTKDKSMEELEDRMKSVCGGININYHAASSPTDNNTANEGISFSSYARDDKALDMYDLIRVLLQETDFAGANSRGQILQLIQANASGATDSISEAGHSYANQYTGAGLSPFGLWREQTGGLTQIQQILELSKATELSELDTTISQLQEIQRIVMSNSSSFRAAITCDRGASSANERSLRQFLEAYPPTIDPPTEDASLKEEYAPLTSIPLPFQVSHVGASMRTVPYTDSRGPALQILSELLTHRHLHHEIREKGGAYGGGAASRALNGTFGFYSYRDPNPENTLNVIRKAGEFAVNKAWTSQDLEEAKLSTFQSVDAPQSVSEEGMTRFLSGVDEDMEQLRRERLLDVTINDVKQVAQDFLIRGAKNLRVAVIGKKQDWIKQGDGWNIKHLDLEGSTARD